MSAPRRQLAKPFPTRLGRRSADAYSAMSRPRSGIGALWVIPREKPEAVK